MQAVRGGLPLPQGQRRDDPRVVRGRGVFLGASKDLRTLVNGIFTPFYVACERGHLPVCRWMLEVGAGGDIAEMCGGWTPMRTTCYKNHLDVCKFLVLSGALNGKKSRNNKRKKK